MPWCQRSSELLFHFFRCVLDGFQPFQGLQTKPLLYYNGLFHTAWGL